MTDEMLSQDQIDALSGGADLSDIGTSTGTTAKNVDYSMLEKAYTIISEQASNVLSTVLGKDVRVSADETKSIDVARIKADYAQNYLVLNVQFNKGFVGPQFYLISKKDTAILADLMMMGDGAAEFEEDHKDAIGELFNQVMGATSTNFGINFSMECGITPSIVSDFAVNSTNIPLGDCVGTLLNVRIQDVVESHIFAIMPKDFAGAMVEKIASTSSASTEDSGSGDDFGAAMGGASQESSNQSSNSSSSMGNFSAQTFKPAFSVNTTPGNINMLLDIQLQVSIELGRTEMSIKRILELGPGSIIELDRMAGEPVDLLVNGKVVAKGEVVVVDENFGIRVVSLVSPEERLKSLK